MNTAPVIRYPRTVAGALMTLVGALAVSSPAKAASAPSYVGTIAKAFQYRGGAVWVAGTAYDRSRPAGAVPVCLAVAGRCVRTVSADQASPAFDRTHHLTGRHRFTARLAPVRPGARIVLRIGKQVLAARYADTPGARAVRLAKRYVGARYAEGGASPRTGFDCSGFTSYVYSHAQITSLPHNAEQQRHVRYMHRVTRANARPGDLIFYFAGGPAYHVAIYAGHGYQYAAATPRDGVRYQPIWSRAIEFRTDWH